MGVTKTVKTIFFLQGGVATNLILNVGNDSLPYNNAICATVPSTSGWFQCNTGIQGSHVGISRNDQGYLSSREISAYSECLISANYIAAELSTTASGSSADNALALNSN
jgi:hypothetical protein